MPLFGKSDEAKKRFKEAIRHIDPDKKEFDLDKATMLLEEAVMLKSYEEKYRKQLEEVKAMKPNLDEKSKGMAEELIGGVMSPNLGKRLRGYAIYATTKRIIGVKGGPFIAGKSVIPFGCR